MQKYIFLISSLFLFALFIFSIYKANSPQVGPIGSGEISSLSWVLIYFPLILGVWFLGTAIYLYSNKNKKQ